ncbi:uncharacterized protein LOC144770793 [Lissotriton helveticus]
MDFEDTELEYSPSGIPGHNMSQDPTVPPPPEQHQQQLRLTLLERRVRPTPPPSPPPVLPGEEVGAYSGEATASPVVTEGHRAGTSGEASSMTATHEYSDTDVTGVSEGDRSLLEESQPETPTLTSSDASGDTSMLAGTGSGNSASSSTIQCPLPTLPTTSTTAARVHISKKGSVSFTPGTAAPAPYSLAAISVESVDLLRQLCVGQTTLINIFLDHSKKLAQVVAFMEGIHSDVGCPLQ